MKTSVVILNLCLLASAYHTPPFRRATSTLTYRYTPYKPDDNDHSSGPCRITLENGSASRGQSGPDNDYILLSSKNIEECEQLCNDDITCVAFEAKVNPDHNRCELWHTLPTHARTDADTYTCNLKISECSKNPCQNGGSCSDGLVIDEYTCSCNAGFSGDNCEINIDECRTNPCQNGGSCTDGDNEYTCSCDAGFSGDNCEINIDECSTNPCVNGSCTDGINEYSCSCDAGFIGDNCEINIDECSTNPCQNGGSCTDGINEYSCSCDAGFTGDNCEINIGECSTNPCQNGGSCTDGDNEYTCSCDAGFSGDNCEINIDECSTNPCQNGGSCIDGDNEYTCSCDAGFSGDNCEINIDECSTNPCQNGGSCIDGVNEYTCSCSIRYSGNHCQTDRCDSGEVRSYQVDSELVKINFKNGLSAGAIHTHWVNQNYESTKYYSRNPGKDYTQPTYKTHPWNVYDDNGDLIIKNFIIGAYLNSCSQNQKSRQTTRDFTKFTIKNNGNTQMVVKWVDGQGSFITYKTLNPGNSYTQTTYPDHVWGAFIDDVMVYQWVGTKYLLNLELGGVVNYLTFKDPLS